MFRLRLPHPSLLVRFAVLSLVLVVALGGVLALRLQRIIEQRNVNSATGNVALAVDIVANQQAAANAVGAVASKSQVASFQSVMKALQKTGHVVGVDAWLRQGIIAYSDDTTMIGTKRTLPADAADAFAGHVRSTMLRGGAAARVSAHAGNLQRRFGDLLVVTVPVRLPQSTKPVAAVQAILRYAPVAAAIRSDTRSMVLLLGAGLAMLYLCLFRLVASASRRLHRQAALNHELATHDNLTGLPNRTLLRDRVEQAVRASVRSGRQVVLLLLDLDRFKDVNDTLGHHHGDRLLQEVGPRLRSVLRDADTVARLGGDEFVVLVPDVAAGSDAVAIGEKLIEVLRVPFELDGVTLEVDTSIGIACTPEHGDTYDDLLQRADIAMYVAKETHSGVSVYTPQLDAHSPTRLALAGELRRAIDDPDQLVCFYQPKADLASDRIVGVEALARWLHPEHGVIPPAEFIPAAERTGLITPLTTRVLNIALAQSQAWAQQGIHMPVAVNVSARCLLDPDFPDEVAALLRRYDIAACDLELELTETTIMSDPERALEALTALHELGVGLSIDDFGTGFASTASLGRLPVRELKIDRAFVTALTREGSDVAIVRSTLELARSLNLRVVAEGVETETVWKHLAELGCDEAQGYFLSRPLPADELTAWLAPASRGTAA